MVRVLPSGPPDYTSQINAREAAANDALARLFYTLMARREESQRMEQLRRDLQAQQHGFTAEQNQLNRDWRTDLEYEKGTRTGPQQQPSYLAPNSGGRTTGAPPPTAAAPSRIAPAAPSSGGFKPGGTVGPNPNKFSSNFPSPYEPNDTDVGEGETVTLSAQSKKPEAAPLPKRGQAPTGTTSQPRQSRRPRQTAQGVWGPIDDRYTSAWDAAEKKYNLPKGYLQTMVGVQHNFGRDDGGDAGWYRMDPSLKQAWGVTPEMSKDLVAMSDVMGKNAARNRDAYNKYVDVYNKANNTNIPKLGNSAAEVPYYAILNQFGVTNGPRVLIAAHVNADVPIASQMAPEQGVDLSRQLVKMGLTPQATGNDLFKNNNGVAKRAADVHNTTIQHQENPPSADDEPPRPRSGVPDAGDIRLGERGAHGYRRGNVEVAPWLVDTVQQASRTLPPGYRAEVISTVDSRKRGTPWHPSGRAIDIKIYDDKGNEIPNVGGPRRPGYKVYEDMAAAAKVYQQQNYPDKKFVWGGHFNSGVPYDRMHFQSTGQSARNFTPQQLADAAVRLQNAPTTATADAAPAPATAPPTTVASKDPLAGVERTPMFNQKPITQPKSAQVNTFGTVASAPLATMQPGLKGALAGAQVAPKMQIAEESPVTIPKGVAAKPAPVAPKGVPATAATAAPPVAAPVVPNVEYGPTDDPNEHAPQPLVTREQLLEGAKNAASAVGSGAKRAADAVIGGAGAVHQGLKDIGWAADDIVKQSGKGLADLLGDATAPLIKAARPDARYTDPQYVESTQGFDEAGMEGVQNYVTPEAVPGQYTTKPLMDMMPTIGRIGADTSVDAVPGAATNSIIQSIKDRAAAYNTLQAGRNESRQLEQVYNYPQEQPRTPTPQPTGLLPDYDELGMPTAAVPKEPDAISLMEQQVELGTRQRQAAEVARQTPPQERESVPTTLSPADNNFAFDPNTEGVPSYGIQARPSVAAPLPVEARVVADAMFNTNTEGVPSYGQALSGEPMTMPDIVSLWDLVKSRARSAFGGDKDQTRATAVPVPEDKRMPPARKAPVREVLPSGEELYPVQPPQVVPPKRAPAKEPTLYTVPESNAPAKGPKTLPSGVPSRGKYDPNAPKVYDRDPNTGKSIIIPQQGQEPIDAIAPNTDDEEQ